MKKFITMLLALLAAGMFTLSFGGCGDDDDGGSDGDADGDSDGDSDGDGDSDSAGGDVDPFADFDCDGLGTDTTKCDAVVCGYKAAADAVAGTDASQCYADFASCYNGACPTGDNIADADATETTACVNEMTTCLGTK